LRLLPNDSPTLRSKPSALSTRLSGQGEKAPELSTVLKRLHSRRSPFRRSDFRRSNSTGSGLTKGKRHRSFRRRKSRERLEILDGLIEIESVLVVRRPADTAIEFLTEQITSLVKCATSSPWPESRKSHCAPVRLWNRSLTVTHLGSGGGLGRVDNSLVNLRRLGNQPGGILEPFVLVIILS